MKNDNSVFKLLVNNLIKVNFNINFMKNKKILIIFFHKIFLTKFLISILKTLVTMIQSLFMNGTFTCGVKC